MADEVDVESEEEFDEGDESEEEFDEEQEDARVAFAESWAARQRLGLPADATEHELLAAEQKAARLAAEQEAARLAAEQEAARLAAEQEAARLAEEARGVNDVEFDESEDENEDTLVPSEGATAAQPAPLWRLPEAEKISGLLEIIKTLQSLSIIEGNETGTERRFNEMLTTELGPLPWVRELGSTGTGLVYTRPTENVKEIKIFEKNHQRTWVSPMRVSQLAATQEQQLLKKQQKSIFLARSSARNDRERRRAAARAAAAEVEKRRLDGEERRRKDAEAQQQRAAEPGAGWREDWRGGRKHFLKYGEPGGGFKRKSTKIKSKGKSSKKKPKIKSSKKKPKRKSTKRKSTKRKSTKRKSTKRKSTKRH